MGAARTPAAVTLPSSALAAAQRLGAEELAALEAGAVRISQRAAEIIAAAASREVSIEYKRQGTRGSAPVNPVTEIDQEVEAEARALVAAEFPGHAFLGEEGAEPGTSEGFLWVVDPLDGTTNFTAGFPLYAAAAACLLDGVPVAGAVWCSVTPELRPGVYHARIGGPFSLDGNPAAVRTAPPRPLAAAPGGAPGRTRWWDHRVTGCAAVECAYVAAGVFQAAVFSGLRVWDVAAGVVLAWAAGRGVWLRDRTGWVPFERFEPAPERRGEPPTLRGWRRTLLLATPEARERLAPARRLPLPRLFRR
ncbi:Inositol-1-monophosphatase ImpA [bacterium HR29]|jgi:myo-inositol-1(or 4)-monophosphatase|nr:Inositol-1-monophosphatase ImpA [bacterium HR29]